MTPKLTLIITLSKSKKVLLCSIIQCFLLILHHFTVINEVNILQSQLYFCLKKVVTICKCIPKSNCIFEANVIEYSVPCSQVQQRFDICGSLGWHAWLLFCSTRCTGTPCYNRRMIKRGFSLEAPIVLSASVSWLVSSLYKIGSCLSLLLIVTGWDTC